MDWNDITKKNPPEGRDLLIYTETGLTRVATRRKGMWNTYLKVVAWGELPDKPDFLDTQEPVVKRGRKKKVQ